MIARLAVALCLLASSSPARADTSVGKSKWANAAPWARACAERLEQARDEVVKREPSLERATVESAATDCIGSRL